MIIGGSRPVYASLLGHAVPGEPSRNVANEYLHVGSCPAIFLYPFRNRLEAGRFLAPRLASYADQKDADVIVLGLLGAECRSVMQ
jgi:hypothetical protein